MTRMRRAAWLGGGFAALTASASVGIAGCNAIVGAGDYHVETGQDAGAGSDATGGVDAMGDVVVRDSGGGDQTSPGDGGNGGDGGCGSGIPTGSADFQKLVKSCVLSIACDPLAGGYFDSMSTCITDNYLNSVPAFGCQANIQDCAGFTTCTGRGFPSTADCMGQTAGWRCDMASNRAIDCETPISNGESQDCTQVGGTCDLSYLNDPNSQYYLPCKLTPTCSGGDGGTDCDGMNEYFVCYNGHEYGENCALEHSSCGGGSCFYNGSGACSQPDTWTCSGDTAQLCSNSNQLLPFDCSAAGGHCVLDSTMMSADCISPGCTVDDFNNCTEMCADATHAQLCVGGAPYVIDCTQYGSPAFTACGSTMFNTTTVVRCQ